jgi:hypothetical protein
VSGASRDSSRGSEPTLTDIVVSPSIPATDERLPPPGRPVGPRANGSTAPGPGRTVRQRAAKRRLGWTLLIGALVATVGVLLSRRFYYGNDDLLQFSAAREDGLSWPYLSLNVFQHFGPYDRLGHWLVLRYTDLSPAPGLALVLLNITALLAASLWLMTELRLSAPRRVVALIVIALSVPMTESAIWFDAGMHILPAIAVTLAVCAAHVRGVRTGRRRWHAVALVLFVLGQLIQERPLLALPLLVLVDVLLLWRSLPWKTRLRRLWELRWLLAAFTVTGAAIAATLQAFVVIDTFATPSWGVTVRHMLLALTEYAAPSLVNQPVRHPAGLPVELAILLGLALGGVVVASARKYNAGPLLFAGGAFLLYFGFLKFSPMLRADLIPANAQRLQNAVYATVPAIIGLAHVRLPAIPRRGRDSTGPHPGGSRSARRALQVIGCMTLASYLVATNVAYLDRRWDGTTEARAYVDAVRSQASAWSDPRVDVVPLLAPSAMATGWSAGLSRHDVLLPFIDKGFSAGDVGPSMVLIDDRGSVRPAVLAPVRTGLDLIDGGCGSSGRTFANDADLYFPPVTAQPLFLRLDYRATDDLQVRLSSGWNRMWTPNSLPTDLPSGSRTRLIPIGTPVLQGIDLQVLTDGAGLCVRGASIVRPLLVEPHRNRCREVDWFGRPGRVTVCP